MKYLHFQFMGFQGNRQNNLLDIVSISLLLTWEKLLGEVQETKSDTSRSHLIITSLLPAKHEFWIYDQYRCQLTCVSDL